MAKKNWTRWGLNPGPLADMITSDGDAKRAMLPLIYVPWRTGVMPDWIDLEILIPTYAPNLHSAGCSRSGPCHGESVWCYPSSCMTLIKELSLPHNHNIGKYWNRDSLSSLCVRERIRERIFQLAPCELHWLFTLFFQFSILEDKIRSNVSSLGISRLKPISLHCQLEILYTVN